MRFFSNIISDPTVKGIATVLGLMITGYGSGKFIERFKRPEITVDSVYAAVNGYQVTTQHSLDYLLGKLNQSQTTYDINPRLSALWTKNIGLKQWYNPPLAYVLEETKKADAENFAKGKITYNILLFSETEIIEGDFKERLERLVKWIKILENYCGAKGFDTTKFIVKVNIGNQSPPISYFLSSTVNSNTPDPKETDESNQAIIYLGREIKPKKCVETIEPHFFNDLTNDFRDSWKSARRLSYNKLVKSIKCYKSNSYIAQNKDTFIFPDCENGEIIFTNAISDYYYQK